MAQEHGIGRCVICGGREDDAGFTSTCTELVVTRKIVESLTKPVAQPIPAPADALRAKLEALAAEWVQDANRFPRTNYSPRRREAIEECAADLRAALALAGETP